MRWPSCAHRVLHDRSCYALREFRRSHAGEAHQLLPAAHIFIQELKQLDSAKPPRPPPGLEHLGAQEGVVAEDTAFGEHCGNAPQALQDPRLQENGRKPRQGRNMDTSTSAGKPRGPLKGSATATSPRPASSRTPSPSQEPPTTPPRRRQLQVNLSQTTTTGTPCSRTTFSEPPSPSVASTSSEAPVEPGPAP